MQESERGEFEYVLSLGNKLGKYIEKWIVVSDNKIIESGDNLKETYAKAKVKCPETTLFVMKVPADKVMVL